MLRIIEYTLLAVSLLVVIGLIVSNARSGPGASVSHRTGLDEDEAQEPGKTV
jgi:hypothetical protein